MRHFTPDRASFIPQDAEAIPTGLALLGVEVYAYVNQKGQPSCLAFSGKQQKPDVHCYYRSVERRDQAINEFLDGVRASLKYKETCKESRVLSVNPLKVGDILTGSWGYDQTNPEAWEVLEVKGQSVRVGALAFETVRGNCGMSEYVRPVPGEFASQHRETGDKGSWRGVWKRVQTHDGGKTVYLSFDHYTATLWDGKREMYHSWYA